MFVVQKRVNGGRSSSKLNNSLTLKIRKTARRVVPAKIRTLLHKILRDQAAITVRYERLDHWPEQDAGPSWREAAVSKGVIKGLAAFDLEVAKRSPERAFSSPIVQDNLKLLSGIPLKEANFLDFGCGNGIYHFILDAYPATGDWKYSGADVNSELIRFCRSILPNTRFEQLEGNGVLPFQDGEFEVVLASGVLQCIRDHGKVLKELGRITRRYLVVSRMPLWEKKSTVLLQYFKHRNETKEEHHPIHVFSRKEFEQQLHQLRLQVFQMQQGSESLLMPDTLEAVSYYGYLLQKEASR